MANTWITSDLHYFHKKIMEHCPKTRPWGSVEEMNEALLEAWNASIKSNDIIYFLGDFSFGKAEETEKILRKLNGQKYLVRGNHDKGLQEKYFGHSADILIILIPVSCNEKFTHTKISPW